MSMLLFVGITNAQQVTKGSRITGRVYDDQGPLSMVNVVEVNNENRIVTHAVANANGEYSIVIKDPSNKLRVNYVGYETQNLSINSTKINIRMNQKNTIPEVTVVATAKTDGIGLSIPVRENPGAFTKIDASEFEGLGITTIDEALQGRVSGLDIVFNSGNLGAGTSMRLRGAASISGSSEPLVVVDGSPLSSTQLTDFDFSNANDEKFAQLLNVNPEDIESITVSKDAAATAVWGSQGTNGVIEIKTKRGNRGSTRVGYTYRVSATQQPDGMKMLNGNQYTMLLKESYFNPTLNDAAANIVELNYDPNYSEYEMYNNNTDWISAVKQTGWKNSHSVSLSGGGEKANFRISAGYDNESGSIIKQNLNRYTTRLALDYFVSERIVFRTNFDMTYTNNQKNYDGLLALAYKKMPNLGIYEEDANGQSTGVYYQVLPTISAALRDDQLPLVNPLASADYAVSRSTSMNITPVFELSYNLLGVGKQQSQLRYDGRIAFGVFNSYDYSFYPSILETGVWSGGDINKVSTSSSKSQSISNRHSLTFTPKFENTDHSFSTLVRAEFNSGTSNSQSSAKYGLPGIPSVEADGTISGFSTSVGESSSIYFTTSSHYAYKGKYIFDFTSRLDATTKLGPSKRWKFQPSFSARWNISDEEFMKKFTWLNMLSIRPSLGFNGEQPGSDYLFYSRYASGNAYNGDASMHPVNIRLTDLHMANVVRLNVGVDFSMFKDKLSGDINAYVTHKSDMLQSGLSIPTSSGYSSLTYVNNGSLLNKGWDLSINANRLLHYKKFNLSFNIAFNNNQNELLSLDKTILSKYNTEFDRSNGSYLTRVQLHNALGSIYGFKYKGVYQYSDYSSEEVVGVSGPSAPVVHNANGDVIYQSDGKAKPMYYCYGTSVAYEFKGGDAIYEDVNNDGNINELDIVYLGSSLPKVMGGFGINIRYGRFSLNNQFAFRLFQKVVNKARMNAESMYTNANQCLSVNWRWRVEGDKTSIPRALYKSGYNWLGSDRFVEDASFLRMNYCSFQYSIDPELLKPFHLKSLNLSLSLSNLFVLTNYSGNDPEVGYGGMNVSTDSNQTPRSKSGTLGVIASF